MPSASELAAWFARALTLSPTRSLLALSCCWASLAYSESSRPPHHTDNGFANSDGSQANKPFSSFLKWRRERSELPLNDYFSDRRIADTLAPLGYPAAAPDFSTPAAGARVTWLGHATFLVQTPRLNFLTDPHFSGRASPFSFAGPKRFVAPPVSVPELPPIDVVVISHNHYDHLDTTSVKALANHQGGSPLFLVPLGLESWMNSKGIDNAIEMDWWQSRDLAGATITMVPVHHWSARGLGDRNQTLWGGWTLASDDFNFFFAGDTGWSDDFADIGKRLGPFDLSAIPVGAYEPRWFMKEQHVNPSEAVDIHLAVGSEFSIGMHWGTFQLTDEPYEQPVTDLADALVEKGVSPDAFVVMAPGAQWDWLP